MGPGIAIVEGLVQAGSTIDPDVAESAAAGRFPRGPRRETALFPPPMLAKWPPEPRERLRGRDFLWRSRPLWGASGSGNLNCGSSSALLGRSGCEAGRGRRNGGANVCGVRDEENFWDFCR